MKDIFEGCTEYKVNKIEVRMEIQTVKEKVVSVRTSVKCVFPLM